MRIEQLEYLVDISKTGSINVSAERMYVTQPTISEAISKLEKELEVSLLHRHTRGVTLTAAGEIVLEEAEDILAHLQEMRHRLADLSNQYDHSLVGNIRIGSTQICNNRFLSEIIVAFSDEFPHIKIKQYEVYQYDFENIFEQLSVDLGFSHCTSSGDVDNFVCDNLRHHGYQVEVLKADDMHVAAHKTMALAKEKEVSLEMLMGYPVIYMDNNIYGKGNMERIFAQRGGTENFWSTGSRKMFTQSVIEGKRAGLVTQKSYQAIIEGSLEAMKNVKLIALKEKIILEYFVAKDSHR